MHALRVVGREDGIIRSVDHTLVKRGEDLGARQVDRRRARRGKDFLHHTFGGAHLQPLQIVHTVQRHLRQKRLEAGGGRANEMQTVGFKHFVHQLIAAAVLHKVEHLLRV